MDKWKASCLRRKFRSKSIFTTSCKESETFYSVMCQWIEKHINVLAPLPVKENGPPGCRTVVRTANNPQVMVSSIAFNVSPVGLQKAAAFQPFNICMSHVYTHRIEKRSTVKGRTNECEAVRVMPRPRCLFIYSVLRIGLLLRKDTQLSPEITQSLFS